MAFLSVFLSTYVKRLSGLPLAEVFENISHGIRWIEKCISLPFLQGDYQRLRVEPGRKQGVHRDGCVPGSQYCGNTSFCLFGVRKTLNKFHYIIFSHVVRFKPFREEEKKLPHWSTAKKLC